MIISTELRPNSAAEVITSDAAETISGLRLLVPSVSRRSVLSRMASISARAARAFS
jgi:hypothetical protein